MSARHWKDRRNFWQALIFWTWLASFIFGFTGTDLFHAANCPEQLALRASSHGDGPSVAHAPPSHALPFDADCLSCLLQLGAQGVLASAVVLSVPFVAAFAFASPRPARASARALITSARGPPVSFI